MFDTTDLYKGLDGLEDIVDGLGEFTGRHGRRTVRNAVEEGTDDTVEGELTSRARRRALPHVEEHAGAIRSIGGQWVGDQYIHGLYTNSDVVTAHEFGTGVHGGGGPYRISGESDGERLAFQDGGQAVVVDYVIHPGVEAKRFMRQTVEFGEDDVADRIEREALIRLDNLL